MERNMQSSALSHYHAFIDSANCMSVVQQQLAKACDGLDELSREVPDLATSFEAFSKDAAAVMAQRNSNKQLLGEPAQCAAVVNRGCFVVVVQRHSQPRALQEPESKSTAARCTQCLWLSEHHLHMADGPGQQQGPPDPHMKLSITQARSMLFHT